MSQSVESLATKPLEQFLAELASANAVPGGGSVAALGGALAAALLAMVCRLTIGKKGYEPVQSEMLALLERVEPLQTQLRDLMQADIDAYARVMAAYQLPKATEADKAARTQAAQAGLQHAAEVPLQVAELCATLLDLAEPIAAMGNRNAASDAGVGAMMAEAGLRGAAFNVSINLGAIKDEAFVARHQARVTELTALADAKKQTILEIVRGRM